MHAYVFQAALLCKQCGESVKEYLAAQGKAPTNPDDEYTYDSDEYPKGPYDDGGGEADCPQHCDQCRTFLGNPLTGDGGNYVRDAIADNNGNPAVLDEWREFYDYLPYRGDDGLLYLSP